MTIIIGLSLLLAQSPVGETAQIAQAIERNGFRGSALVAKGDDIVWQTSDRGTDVWPWASVTKQVVATLVMQEVDRGRLSLDAPASTYLPELREGAGSQTIRQLLQHRAGLRNPNDTPEGAAGLPSFYSTERQPLGWCTAGRKAPGGEWSYNNCDYIVLGAVLERVTKQPAAALIRSRLVRPLGLKNTRLLTRRDAKLRLADGSAAVLAGFGTGAALAGTPGDLLRFDRALMSDKLISRAARDQMWAGDPKLGYMALGQWSFSMPLKGCAAPVRIIERRGNVGSTQVRNILLPDQDMTVILFTGDGKLDFGEIWQGKGLSHDVLRAAACP